MPETAEESFLIELYSGELQALVHKDTDEHVLKHFTIFKLGKLLHDIYIFVTRVDFL
jgi:hypothetical protein